MAQPYDVDASPPPGPYARRALLFAPVFCLFALIIAFSIWASLERVGTTFPGFFIWDNGYLVALHESTWSGAEASLPLNGGRVTHVNGDDLLSGSALSVDATNDPPGVPYRYDVVSEGRTRQYIVPTARFELSDSLRTLGVYVGAAILFFLIASISLLLQPGDTATRALALASAWVGASLCFAVDYIATHRAIGAYLFTEATTPAVLWNLAIRFPISRTNRVARGTLVALGALGLTLFALAWSGYYAHPERSRAIAGIAGILTGLAGVAIGVNFFRAFWNAGETHVRRQAAVVLAAGLVAITVPGLLVIGFFVLGWDFSWAWIVLPLPIFPAAVLYSIVRQDLLTVERFARLTTGYVLATGSLALVYALVVFSVERGVDPGASTHPFLSLLLLLSFAMLFEPLRRRTQGAVDRAFYRNEIAPGTELEQAGFALAQARSAEDAVETVCTRAERALSAEWVAFRKDGEVGPAIVALRASVRFRDQHLGVLECGEKHSGAPFSDAERELLRGFGTQLALGLETARSIEELRDAQEMLVRSERLAAIGEFAGSMAHGIRNPLAGIRATAEVGVEEPAESEETLRTILSEVDRVEQRIQTLLDFSRPFEPDLQAVDLRTVVDEVLETSRPRARRDGVEFAFTAPERAVWARVDPDYLAEVLLELVGNALSALDGTGLIELEVGAADEGNPWLLVRDDGPGIPEAVRDRVFELFFTTRDHGTGLGLASARKTIMRMGGSISLRDDDGPGTCFRIEVLTADPELASAD